jgi:predicted AAA+ superfamily ATPase
MIQRTLAGHARDIFMKYPIITITGPRQSGKTTLARAVFPEKAYVNLENPAIRQFAMEDPNGLLDQYPDGAVIDEIQRVPDLVSYLQVIVDEKRKNSLFVLTGSQQFSLMKNVSQSLAGRTALLKLLPFSIEETASFGEYEIDDLIFKGFYPRIYDQDIPPSQALGDYYETYVERDVRQLVNVRNTALFQRFVRLCAGRTGQLVNLNSLADDTGVSHSTAREWMSVLEASYVVFLLQPFHANIKKRLVKSPKIYFYDVGLASWLCGIEDVRQLTNHPLRGNLFENLVVMEALKHRLNQGKRNNLFFYRDSSGNEIDLLYARLQQFVTIEIKSGKTITSDYFKGIKKFAKNFPDLAREKMIVYAGDESQERNGIKVFSPFKLAAELNRIDQSDH